MLGVLRLGIVGACYRVCLRVEGFVHGVGGKMGEGFEEWGYVACWWLVFQRGRKEGRKAGFGRGSVRFSFLA